MKRKTQVLLEILWNDEEVMEHPAGWDYRTLLSGDPFTTEQGSHEVRFVSFTDVDEAGNPEQT